MDEIDQRISNAVLLTHVLRQPKQHLATFGVSNLRYYLVTEPSYDLAPGVEESVIRQGQVVSQRPAIVTPTYMLNLEGFSQSAQRYMESLMSQFGPNIPGLLYQYHNEPGGLEIISGRAPEVAQRIASDLDKQGLDSTAVILGVDDLWDVSILKFIYEYTASSLTSNIGEMQAKGLFEPDPDIDVPRGVAQRIEELFRQVGQGYDPKHLHRELVRWGLFGHYQDRFLNLFRRR
jgi:hypothetical protein